MKLRTLRIENCRLIRHWSEADLPFVDDAGVPRNWTMLVGENGLGKTTALKAIALLAAGRDGAKALIGDPQSLVDIRCDPRVPVELFAEFSLGDDLLSSIVRIEPGEQRVLTRSWLGPLSQHVDDYQHVADDVLSDLRAQVDSPRRADLLAVGLGVTRSIPGSEPVEKDTVLRTLGPLFGRQSASTNLIEVVDAAAENSEERLGPRLAQYLDEALSGTLLERVKRLERRGMGGISTAGQLTQSARFDYRYAADADATIRLPAVWLSQGYQALLTIATDILGTAFIEHRGAIRPSDITGLALIDELDLHVHPRWQKHLVRDLRKIFPEMQFVATTHAPLLLSELDTSEVFRLAADDETGDVFVRRAETTPKLQTRNQLYAEFYGITDEYPSELGERFEEFLLFAGDPYRSDDEDALVEAARAALAQANHELPFEVVPRDPDGAE